MTISIVNSLLLITKMLTLEDLYQVYAEHKDEYSTRVQEFTIGHKHFKFNTQTAIAGVINLSTDSWWIHSICYTAEQAIQRGKVLNAEGADIVDIGAESMTAGTARADEFKQKSELLPVIRTLSEEKVLTSVETYYPTVARECLKAGANVINYTGHENSEEMYQAIADYDAAIIICYVQGKHARDVGEFDFSKARDPINLVYDFLAKEIEKATKCGVTKIMVDPAIGVGYTNFYFKYNNAPNRIRYQINALLNGFRLKKLGFPVFNMIPTAMEFFGEEVRSAQVFMSVFAALGGSNIVRTHETAKIRAILDIFTAV